MTKSPFKLLLSLAIFLSAFLLLQVEHSADPERIEELGYQEQSGHLRINPPTRRPSESIGGIRLPIILDIGHIGTCKTLMGCGFFPGLVGVAI